MVKDGKRIVIGVISDTHGVLSQYAIDALDGADYIINAGDCEKKEIVEKLKNIAETVSVRGNMDYERWARSIKKKETVTISGKTFHILHNLNELDIDPATEGIDFVISGHTHVPGIQEKKGVIFMNPGSAGRKRYHYPHTVGKIIISNRIETEIIPIEDP